MSYKLIGVGNNTKIVKGDNGDFLTAIQHLKPRNTKICPFQNVAMCKAPCLDTAGRGKFNNVQSARERKTDMYLYDRITYMDYLHVDLTTFRRRAKAKGAKPCVRLNGTSDILWERTDIHSTFYDMQFYDYTKVVKRAYTKLPSNYHLTLSYSQANKDYADKVYQAVLDTGINMAVVSTQPMPKKFKGLDCIDGDQDDLRFLDPQGVAVWLSAKGSGKKDTSGFVIHKL
jgi:hypothetical protein